MVLLADYYIQPRVSLAKPVQRSVIGKGRADQHNAIKLAIEWPAELVHEKPSLSGVGRTNYQRVERNIARIHLILHRIKLPVENVKLGVGDDKYLAVNIS